MNEYFVNSPVLFANPDGQINMTILIVEHHFWHIDLVFRRVDFAVDFLIRIGRTIVVLVVSMMMKMWTMLFLRQMLQLFPLLMQIEIV